MRRTVVVCALGVLALFSGCVAPSERIPVNRGYGQRSWFGAPRQSLFLANPSSHAPSDFWLRPGSGFGGMATASNSSSSRLFASSSGDTVPRPALAQNGGGMSRYFPGLSGQRQVESARLSPTQPSDSFLAARTDSATARNPLRGELTLTSEHTSPSADLAVRETSAEEESDTEEEAPLLPISLKIEAYPAPASEPRPEPTNSKLPPPHRSRSVAEVPTADADRSPVPPGGFSTDPPREEPPAREPEPAQRPSPRDRQAATVSALIPIPGLEESPARPEPRRASARDDDRDDHRADPSDDRSSERPRAPQPRPTEHAYGRYDVRGSSSIDDRSNSSRFRVTPRAETQRQTSVFEPDPTPRRGPLTRLFQRIRGQE